MEIDGLASDRAWDWENGYFWFSHPSRINKFLAHYGLYQMILNLPGDVFEMGVFKAGSMIRWATFRQLLENSYSRRIVGFDTFGKFPTKGVELDVDQEYVEAFVSRAGDGLSRTQVDEIFKRKGFENIELLEGNVSDTLPHFVMNNPACRIALLHLDLNVKEPTEFALEALYDRVVPGGLIVIDDYTSVVGATEAIDDLAADKGLAIEKLSFHSVPAFIRKPKPDFEEL
ncbi:MAG: dTDP-6-deoxy-L-hexose 3-O-methyltransferase [Marinosulfonomonas sp.]|nr:MAG: dTDP-6-deoxy-L-hexose 3-O-methyltransferase [Marinosulfonomonas sp.]